jgi:hypothetical protein
MNEALKKEAFSEEEKQRLVSLFKILIQIDRKNRITPTAQQQTNKRGSIHGA